MMEQHSQESAMSNDREVREGSSSSEEINENLHQLTHKLKNANDQNGQRNSNN